MSTQTQPQEISILDPGKKWIHVKEAGIIYNEQEPKNLTVSARTFHRWCREGKHGLICGEDNSGMIVVRKDTIPTKIRRIN